MNLTGRPWQGLSLMDQRRVPLCQGLMLPRPLGLGGVGYSDIDWDEEQWVLETALPGIVKHTLMMLMSSPWTRLTCWTGMNDFVVCLPPG
jgi:hypothetical protein